MSKSKYVSKEGSLKNIINGYISISGIQKKIVGAYVAVSGVLKSFWSSDILVYYGNSIYGNISALDAKKQQIKGVSSDFYGAFLGGTGNSVAYDSTLSMVSIPQTGYGNIYDPNVGYNGVYIVMAGGISGAVATNAVVGYRGDTLNKSYGPLLSVARLDSGTVSFIKGKCVLIDGGRYNGIQSGVVNTTEAITQTFTKITLNPANAPRMQMASAALGDYAVLFGGGQYTANQYSNVNYWDSTLSVQTIAAPLSQARANPVAATINGYSIVAGGRTGSIIGNGIVSTVDAYDDTLTKLSSISSLTVAREGIRANVVNKKYVLFSGGYVSNTIRTDVVDVYDDTLTRLDPMILEQARGTHGTFDLGKYSVIGGGYNNDLGELDSVEVFTTK